MRPQKTNTTPKGIQEMQISELLNGLMDFNYIIRRQGWKNARKALYISDKGQLSVIYINSKGCISTSGYCLYCADIKATDWVKIELPEKTRGLQSKAVSNWLNRGISS